MASEKQLSKWYNEAVKINDNPEYVQMYVQYRQKAKRADQQLVRLEALSHEKHFQGVLEFSYKRAVRDIRSWGGDRRFNTAPPTNITQLEAKLKDIETFLTSSTNTKTKILSIYKKRADTINKRYGAEFGVEFTWQDIANYYGETKNQRLGRQLGSKTEIRVLAVMKGITGDKLKDVSDVNQKIDRITGKDKIVAKETKKLLEMGYTYDKLMGGN